MTPNDSDFDRLIRGWRAGEPGALGELFARYSDHIRNAVRRRLHDKLRPQYDSLDFVPDNCDAALWDRQPSASRWVMGREQWERLVRQFPPAHRAILDRLRDGYTHEEIAAMVGVCVRTVERIVRRLRELSES